MNAQAIILLCFWGHILVTGFEFEDAGQSGVHFGDQTGTTRKITVDENNDGGRATIVQITGVAETLTINVNSPYNDVLGVTKEDTSDSTKKTLSANILDYEALRIQGIPASYSIDVIEGVDLNTKKTLSVSIKNLDDESPTIVITACNMTESEIITVDNSPCKFEISDPDGLLSTMDYSTIIGVNGEKDLFGFEYKIPPMDTDQTAEVYLVIKNAALDFETTKVYNFILQAKDAGGHGTTPENVSILVNVGDISDQPPIWNNFTQYMIISENEKTTIQVHAIDGDFGINNDINYRINDTSGKNFVSIDQTTGLITIEEIDRDQGNDVIEFEVTAFEVPDTWSSTTGNIIIIVNDIDDNLPIITITSNTIFVDEGSSSLGLDISVNDIDQGENASYSIALINDTNNFNEAFSVQPSVGFANTSVILNVIKPELLDYENVTWKAITLQLQTVGINTPVNSDTVIITINLLDINDEFPEFDSPDGYMVNVSETVPNNYIIEIIQATDKDYADQIGLKHEIIGSWGNSNVAIEERSGIIRTIKDNVFNYEILNQMTVNIRATDAVNHTTDVLLTINVLDVNDEPPTFTVLLGPIDLDENPADNTELNIQIIGNDFDTDPNLEFWIDWSQSKAYKNSQIIATNEFDNTIKVETIHAPNTKQVNAKLTTTTSPTGTKIDYEAFDTISLQLVITDYNTVVNSDSYSSSITINIVDLNDSPPIIQDITDVEIEENLPVGTLVTTVVAIDEDTGSQVVYSLHPQGSTPGNLLTINATSGAVTVEGPIDCDNPVLDFLVYEVTATDGVNQDSVILNITVKDVNDNVPSVQDGFAQVPENQVFVDPLVSLVVRDSDRDLDFNTVVCSFDNSTSTDVTNKFEIDGTEIRLVNGLSLDREETAQYVLNLTCVDNPNNVGNVQNIVNPPPKVTIIVQDINDDYPTIVNTEIFGKVDDTATQGYVVDVLNGYDADEGYNGFIKYEAITKIKRYLHLSDIDNIPSPDPPQDLFSTEPSGSKDAILLVNNSLTGYDGYLVLTIKLTDLGTPQLSSDVDVTVEVRQT